MEYTYKFFSNKDCKFFPCHKNISEFNCLFCYCPFYSKKNCPGTPEFIKKTNGNVIKNCSNCVFPHKIENYEKIIDLLKCSNFTYYANKNLFKTKHGGENNFASKCKIDFSVNVNPLGIPKGVKKVLFKNISILQNYPDRFCTLLKQKLSCKFDIPTDNILCSNGASELISIAVTAIMPKTALLVSPSFSGYEKALNTWDTKIFFCPLSREENYCFTDNFFKSFYELLKNRMDIVFLCNPNNPNGSIIPYDHLISIANACEQQGTFLIVDECFLGFVNSSEKLTMRNSIKKFKYLLVIDAATKLYSLPGLRLGWAFSSNIELLNRMKQIQPEWSVSTLAQLAGIALLEDDKFLIKTKKTIALEREYLSTSLKNLGCKVYPSESNFILFTSPKRIEEAFLLHKISIRLCSDFKTLTELDYRIAIRRHKENKIFISIMKEILCD